MERKWALITGASSGFGIDFATIMARMGFNLVLVARRLDRLEKVKAELLAHYPVVIEIISKDLSSTKASEDLHQQIIDKKITISYLINNAGFGVHGSFAEQDPGKIDEMISLNIASLTRMCSLFTPSMVEKGEGRILNVASIAAFMPCPGYASYAATKSYVLSFSQSLAFELRNSGVTVTALCPGIAKTEFMQVAGQGMNLYTRLALMESYPIAQAGLMGMFAGKAIVVPGWLNKFNTYFLRFIPRAWWPNYVDLFTGR